MLYSFSTLGTPLWGLEEVVKYASEYGFDAIDFRGLGKHKFENGAYLTDRLNITSLREFTTDIENTTALIKDFGLCVSGVSTGVSFATGMSDEIFEEAIQSIILAEKLNSPMIRVFCGKYLNTKTSFSVALENIIKGLNLLSKEAEKRNVSILVETHDDWVKKDVLKNIMEDVDHKNVGLLWDVHHPYRYGNETPKETWQALSPWIKNTHWKDSKLNSDKTYTSTPIGEGDIPLAEILNVLKDGGYTGYLTLEHEAMWGATGDAEIILPQFINYMNKCDAKK